MRNRNTLLMGIAGIAVMAMVVQTAPAQVAPKTLSAVRQQLGQAPKSAAAPAPKPAPVAAPKSAPVKADMPKAASASVSTAKAAASKPTAAVSPVSASEPIPVAMAAVGGAQGGAKAGGSAAGPRRDPFTPLFSGDPNQGRGTGPAALPPGKAGLTVGTLHLDGLVNGPNGPIAVVSNPQQRVYFLHEGDRIFDGQVTHITMEAVSFQQTGRDPFGNALEHEVTRRLYATPGEQR